MRQRGVSTTLLFEPLRRTPASSTAEEPVVACSTFLRVTIYASASASSAMRVARGDTASIRWTVGR